MSDFLKKVEELDDRISEARQGAEDCLLELEELLQIEDIDEDFNYDILFIDLKAEWHTDGRIDTYPCEAKLHAPGVISYAPVVGVLQMWEQKEHGTVLFWVYNIGSSNLEAGHLVLLSADKEKK